MKMFGALFLGCALMIAVGVYVLAAEKKEEPKKVTLKGTIGCSKCEFKLTDDCGTAIKVKEGDKEVIYLVLDEGKDAKYHDTICSTTKEGSVSGVVGQKHKQKTIKPDKDGVKFE
jgi:hypothetical protein